jgi:two-component system chemotaxis family response regulator WspR
MIARYGGEEFVVILPETNAEGACVVAENLRKAIASLERSHSASTTAEHVSISLGIAQADFAHMESQEDLIKQADKGLYSAKESGRNRYKIAS